MTTVIWAVAGSVAVLAAVVVLLLAVPVVIRVEAAHPGGPPLYIRFRWLFGIVRFGWTPGTDEERPAPPPGEVPSRKAARRTRRRRRVPGFMRERAFWFRAGRTIVRVLGRIRFRRVYGRIRFGFDDPADTGAAWGMLSAAGAATAWALPRTLRIEPDFTGPAFEAEGAGEVQFVPLALTAPFVGLALWVGARTARRRMRR